MNQHVHAQKIKAEQAAIKRLAIGAIKSAIARIDEIRSELVKAGTALEMTGCPATTERPPIT
jgi:hypothetical protein